MQFTTLTTILATSLATLAAAAPAKSTTHAKTVTLQTTACLQPVKLETFTIPLNALGRGAEHVCGLKILSSTADVHKISCLGYKDAAGTQPGSARFTYDEPALVATNPVQIGSIRCDLSN